MGAFTMELDNLNKNINNLAKAQKEREKKVEILAQKREQEKERKQYEKDLLIACENDLTDNINQLFKRVIEKNGTNQISIEILKVKLQNMEYRNGLIEQAGENEIQQRYLQKKYNKIVNDAFKNWQNHILGLQLQKQLEEQRKQEEMQKKTWFKILLSIGVTGFIIWFIFKWSIIIGILAIIIGLYFLCLCAKGK